MPSLIDSRSEPKQRGQFKVEAVQLYKKEELKLYSVLVEGIELVK